MFKVQARLSGESDIVLEFDFEKSEIDRPTVVTEATSSAPQGTSRMTCQTTLRIRDGSSALAGGMISQSNGTESESYVVVSASIDKTEKTKLAANSQPFSQKPTAKPDVTIAPLTVTTKSPSSIKRNVVANVVAPGAAMYSVDGVCTVTVIRALCDF